MLLVLRVPGAFTTLLQLQILEAPWTVRYNSGQVPMRDGRFTDPADAAVYANIKHLKRPIEAEDAAVAAGIHKKLTFRRVAIQHYGRCAAHTLVVRCHFQMCQAFSCLLVRPAASDPSPPILPPRTCTRACFAISSSDVQGDRA